MTIDIEIRDILEEFESNKRQYFPKERLMGMIRYILESVPYYELDYELDYEFLVQEGSYSWQGYYNHKYIQVTKILKEDIDYLVISYETHNGAHPLAISVEGDEIFVYETDDILYPLPSRLKLLFDSLRCFILMKRNRAKLV